MHVVMMLHASKMHYCMMMNKIRKSRMVISIRHGSPYADRSKAVLLLWIIHVIYIVRLLCFLARLFIVALWSPAGKGLTSWLSFVMTNCEFVTFQLVSWVSCGTWLYRFLIFSLSNF